MFDGFLERRSTWIIKGKADMLEATSRKKKERVTSADDERNGSDETEEGELDVIDAADEDADDEEEEIALGELTELEQQINENVALHPWPDLDTRLHACKKCGMSLPNFTAKIHHHEIHSVIVAEAHGGDDEKK